MKQQNPVMLIRRPPSNQSTKLLPSTQTLKTQKSSMPTVQFQLRTYLPIHSSNKRQQLYNDNTYFGKLYKGFFPQNFSTDERDMGTSQIKNKTIDEENLGIGNMNMNKTASNFARTSRHSTASGQKRRTESMPRLIQAHQFEERVPTRENMGSAYKTNNFPISPESYANANNVVDEGDSKNFQESFIAEKFDYVKFCHATKKDYLRSMSLQSSKLKLMPLDARREIIEALMRDYFLNLVPENSNYLVFKNSETADYLVAFTNKLIPVCKICQVMAFFDISKTHGFRVTCTSEYCKVKVLYVSVLHEHVVQSLWPFAEAFPQQIEPSIKVRSTAEKSDLSRLIQSGKFKNIDLSEMVKFRVSEVGDRPLSSPHGIGRTTSAGKISRIIIESRPGTSAFSAISRPTTHGMSRTTNAFRTIQEGIRKDPTMSLMNHRYSSPNVLKKKQIEGIFLGEKNKSTGYIQSFQPEQAKPQASYNPINVEVQSLKEPNKEEITPRRITTVQEEKNEMTQEDSMDEINDMVKLMEVSREEAVK